MRGTPGHPALLSRPLGPPLCWRSAFWGPPSFHSLFYPSASSQRLHTDPAAADVGSGCASLGTQVYV